MSEEKISNLDAPVEIAGAGPAGLTAAIQLAQAGRKVIVYERHKEVGHRFGRDFQGLENWTTEENVLSLLKSQGITTDFATAPCNKVTVFDYKEQRYELYTDKPLFYLVERGPGAGSLDSALLRQALELGVDVRLNSRLREMKGEGILAAGPGAADAIAVGYHFDTDMEDGYWAICDDNLAPHGYAYLLVMKGRGTVKTCMFTGFKQEKMYVERTIEAFERLVGLDMKNPRAHGGAGNFLLPRSAYSGLHPLVGEHAGFQDTLWGFGMRLAMSSGRLAARSLVTHENYDKLWKRELKPQMEASIVNRALYSICGNQGYRRVLGILVNRPDIRASLRRQYRMSLSKRLAKPWAMRRYTSKRKDVSCDHVDCHCIWCRGECCEMD